MVISEVTGENGVSGDADSGLGVFREPDESESAVRDIETGARVPWNKGKKLPPEVLTRDELRALLRAPSHRAPTGVRNAAVLAVMWGAGLRVAEAVALRPADYDAEAGTLRVLHGKGDKTRIVALVGGEDALRGWLWLRRGLGLNGRHPLFSTLNGKPLSTAYVRQMVTRMANRARIERRVSPHTLRHTHAYQLVQDGQPVTVIQQQLGHANVAVTARYLQHLNPAERVHRLRQLRWDDRLTSNGNGEAQS